MTKVTLPGYPRIGQDRELKKATERYWRDPGSEADMLETARALRERHWRRQAAFGVDLVPVGDFSLYDTMLDATSSSGASRSGTWTLGAPESLAVYFAMARGTQELTALEMTKWFDTNYHYIVPEIDGRFALHADRLVAQVREAMALGLAPKPVVPGPYTFLRLAHSAGGLTLVDALHDDRPSLRAICSADSKEEGVAWVALDEPALVLEETPPRDAVLDRIPDIAAGSKSLKILVQTYFEDLGENRALALELPVDGIGIDLVRAPAQWELLLEAGGLPADKIVVAGVVERPQRLGLGSERYPREARRAPGGAR